MTRAEHLEWAKRRAREYHERGDMMGAVMSKGSDLNKHPETEAAAALVLLGAMEARRGDMAAVKRWIEGFQ